MSEIPHALSSAATMGGCASLLYTGVLITVALVSVLARTPRRREDARSTLSILLRRRSQ